MEIKYATQPSSPVTVGIGDYSGCGDRPHGIAPELWEAAKASGALFSSAEHAQMRNCENLTAYARPNEVDEPAPEVGRDVVRDKLIIRDGERYEAKLDLLRKYLASQLASVERLAERNDLRMERAQMRLDAKLAEGRE